MAESEKGTHTYHEPPLRQWILEGKAIEAVINVALERYDEQLWPLLDRKIRDAVKELSLADLARHARATQRCIELHEKRCHTSEPKQASSRQQNEPPPALIEAFVEASE